MLYNDFFGYRIASYTRVISAMLWSDIVNHQYTIKLVYLGDGRMLFRFDRVAIFAPRNGQREVAFDDSAREAGAFAHIQHSVRGYWV